VEAAPAVPDLAAARVQPGSRVATPLCRLAQDLALLAGWRRYGLAFVLGLGAAAALPPVDLTPLVFACFPALLWLDDGSVTTAASFRLGYCFGLGYFLAGLYWIAAALFVDIAAFWWLVPFAALGLPAVMALYIGAALGVTHFAARRLDLSPTTRVFAFAIAWAIAEWVRGHALTGLPWNLIGYVWSGGFPGALAVLQTVAVTGIYGLSLITVLAASFPALLGAPSLAPLSSARRWAPAAVAAALILIPGVLGAARLANSPTRETAIRLRIVQPSIAQTLKWDPAAAVGNLRRLIDLSSGPTPDRLAAVLWPEAATPFLLDRDAAARAQAAAVAPAGGYLITGALRANPAPAPVAQIWNSIEAFDRNGDTLAVYDKAHLVPFGEYVPFRGLLPLHKITAGTMDLSAGPGPRTLALAGLPPFAPLICYEAIFPGAIVDEAHRPDWLLNVTNDAWYGRTSGPFQHFAIARTRAVEEALPLVRVANNGVSGVVDANGRVLARINLDAVGHADVALPAAGAPTLYGRVGDWVLVAMLLLAALPVALRLP
jgi:apolipoprotein N-acyltransferase